MIQCVEEGDQRRRKKIGKLTTSMVDDDDDDRERPWSQLPDLALHSISMCLGVMDLCAFGGVCMPWRSVSRESRREFMESHSQPPMLMFTANRGSGEEDEIFPVLYSMSEKRFYAGRKFRGSPNWCLFYSNGYLIWEKSLNRQLLLVNPFTGDVISLPKPPFVLSNPILFSSPTSSNFAILSFDPLRNIVGYRYLNSPRWEEHHYSVDWHIIRSTLFDDRVYALTHDGRLATFDLTQNPKMKLLEIEPAPISEMPYTRFSPCLLADCNEELWLLDLVVREEDGLIEMERFALYRMDFWTGKWEKEESLKGKALFVGDRWCSIATNPTSWGGRENCIYLTGFMLRFCNVYSFDRTLIEIISFSCPYNIIGEQNWIFPSL